MKMDCLKKKRVIAVLLVVIISFLTLTSPYTALHIEAAEISSSYITNVKISQTGKKVTVSYTAKKVPAGIKCYIGYETPSGRNHVNHYELIGKAGKHKVSWNITGGISRVYTKVKKSRARESSKNVLKKIYNIKTGTKYHQVTKKEEKSHTLNMWTLGAGIGAIGVIPGAQSYAFQLVLFGVASAYSALSYIQYSPEYPHYIKMTASLNKTNDTLKTTITVYAQKNGKQIHQWVVKRYLGF